MPSCVRVRCTTANTHFETDRSVKTDAKVSTGFLNAPVQSELKKLMLSTFRKSSCIFTTITAILLNLSSLWANRKVYCYKRFIES